MFIVNKHRVDKLDLFFFLYADINNIYAYIIHLSGPLFQLI